MEAGLEAGMLRSHHGQLPTTPVLFWVWCANGNTALAGHHLLSVHAQVGGPGFGQGKQDQGPPSSGAG